MNDVAYRIRCENLYDHVLGHELRVLPSGFLHLRIMTLYAYPKATELNGGLAIEFGGNTTYVELSPLQGPYRLFIASGWYTVDVLYAPFDRLEAAPTMRDIFSRTDQAE